MTASVRIFPVGHVEEDVLTHLVRQITRRCGLECCLDPGRNHPTGAFDKNRRQYDARAILEQLRCRPPPAGVKHLGITTVDLFVPILTFVFGLSRINGRCGIVSLHRLRPEFYQQAASVDLMLERLEKTAVHELGHAFGLTHCPERRCVMYAATRIEDTDAKGADFCPLCRDVFTWRVLENVTAVP